MRADESVSLHKQWGIEEGIAAKDREWHQGQHVWDFQIMDATVQIHWSEGHPELCSDEPE